MQDPRLPRHDRQRENYRKPFEPLMPGVRLRALRRFGRCGAQIDDTTACMIVEAIQGEGGIIIPPDGYLRDLRVACDKVGALLIVDEVQTLLGRTGKWFGSDHDGVSPDLMPMAKALGGGIMPIEAVMGTAAVWEKIYSDNPLSHTSTFGGNPLACSAALAAIQVIEEEGLIERSNTMGALLKDGLSRVGFSTSRLIKEVRGKRLMIGLEFQMDEVGELVVAQMLMRGMCVAYTLNNPRVLQFEPP